jgi:predicted small secreted protein
MGSWVGLRSGFNILILKEVIAVCSVVFSIDCNTNCGSGEDMKYLANLTYLLMLSDAVNVIVS